MKSVCVYCGASQGVRKSYTEAAKLVGRLCAQKGVQLVYGGGNVGLMGTVATSALDNGGKVIGVIPQSLIDRELAHLEVTELKVVQTMHERKAYMEQVSDAFIAIPGGFGTLDELFEIVTWAQLDFHKKPIGILNVDGYFDSLLQFMDHSVREGFVRPHHRDMIIVDTDADNLLARLKAASAQRSAQI